MKKKIPFFYSVGKYTILSYTNARRASFRAENRNRLSQEAIFLISLLAISSIYIVAFFLGVPRAAGDDFANHNALPYVTSLKEPNNPGDILVLLAIEVENYPDAARVSLRTNRYFEYIDYELENGSFSIIFDPAGPLYTNIKDYNFNKDGLISGLKIEHASDRYRQNLPVMFTEDFYSLDYFVITLIEKTNYYIYQRAGLIVIDIGKRRLPKPQELVSSFVIKRRPGLPAPVSLPGEAEKAVLQSGASEDVLQPQELASQFVRSNLPQSQVALPAPGTGPQRKPGQPPAAPALVKISKQEQIPGATFKDLRDRIMSKAEMVARMELPKGKKIFSYNDCLEVATVNYVPLVVAEEEIKLNDLKVKEAQRGLYPAAVAKYTTTDGKSLGVEFTEKSYGMQVEQPVYYGGRIKLSIRQAQINREVAQTKYDKAEVDIVAKITEAFYNMSTAQINLADQQQLKERANQILAMARKKYGSELTTRVELLNVESQCNQIDYQVAVAAKDLEISRINLLQAMGVEAGVDMLADFSLEYKELVLDLNNCLLLAYQNRPELHMNELLQESAEYDEKIAKSKDDFKVDFTGFLGESGGAYKTENLDMGSDWYVGLKASKPWLGNIGSYSYTNNKTSPRLGQSTRTSAESHSFELGILNNITSYSEKQSALIGKLKAESELIEIEKAINLEVREAFNNYEKAVIQIKNTLDKIEFRSEEVKVLQSQAELNEALLSQVLEAEVKLNDERALHHQAIASYKTALANLNKAIGLIGYFD